MKKVYTRRHIDGLRQLRGLAPAYIAGTILCDSTFSVGALLDWHRLGVRMNDNVGAFLSRRQQYVILPNAITVEELLDLAGLHRNQSRRYTAWVHHAFSFRGLLFARVIQSVVPNAFGAQPQHERKMKIQRSTYHSTPLPLP